MTNYDTIKVLKFMRKQVAEDSDEYTALAHAIEVLELTDTLVSAMSILTRLSKGADGE